MDYWEILNRDHHVHRTEYRLLADNVSSLKSPMVVERVMDRAEIKWSKKDKMPNLSGKSLMWTKFMEFERGIQYATLAVY